MAWRAIQSGLFDDPSFVTLPETAQLLYLRICIKEADSYGRCIGHPAIVRGAMSHHTIEETCETLRILFLADLVYWYADPGPDKLGRHNAWIEVRNWERDQPQRYLAHRGEPRLPGPNAGHVDAVELFTPDDSAAPRLAGACQVPGRHLP
jgi:hypothetical protein